MTPAGGVAPAAALDGAGGAALPARDPVAVVIAAGVLALAAVVGALAVVHPLLAVAAAAGAALFALVVAHPPLAAYAYLALAPLVAGIDRGALLPLVRPNEAVLVLLAAGVALRLGYDWAAGRARGIRFDALDAVLVAMAACSSVLPLLSLVARGQPVTLDDVMFATTLWKLVLLFWLVRAVVVTPAQVATALRAALAAVAVVCLVAVLQSLRLAGVPELLATLYAPFEDSAALAINRGTSTLSSAHAVADVAVFALAVALAWLLRGGRPRWLLAAGAVVFTFGVVAAGQFSGLIGLAVAVVAVGYLTGRLGRLVTYGAPLCAVVVAALWPVVARRLAGFAGPGGIPESWVGRWENLQGHVWPELFSDWRHVALGVRPDARVAAPEWWRDWIWIESGHTWLLWNGGVPLLAAFLVLLVLALRAAARSARAQPGAGGVAGVAAFAAVWVVAVLSVLDPHLTLRGTADLLFPLLALAVGWRPRPVTGAPAGPPETEEPP